MKRKLSLSCILMLSTALFSCEINFNNKSSKDSTPNNSAFDSTNNNSSYVSTDTRTLSLYGINDFHGAVNANMGSNEPGIVALGSFLKEKKQQGNTLLLNSGDMWQGSIESNYNYGRLLTEAMNEIGFDCFTLGNHEFDWGQDYIQLNRNLSDTSINNGYQTPFLAANIHEFDISTKTVGSYADLGDKYIIRELENGLKVGIIGLIGKDQITSICSQFVDDISFENPTPIIKQLSDELRTQKGVDVVVLDVHTDQGSITENEQTGVDSSGITGISTLSNKRYVDAVFCAHTHRNETDMINGVPFIQTNGYGQYVSNVELTVSKDGDVTCSKYNNISSSTFSSKTDTNLEQLVQKYKAESDVASNEKIGYIYGNLTSSESLPNFVTAAIAYYAEENNIDVDYTMTNYGRSNVPYGDVTYGNLYRALPFDNEIYVIETTGQRILNEARYDSTFMYRINKEAIDPYKTYRLAVIDYMAFHRNDRRDYNYFPGLTIIAKFTKDGKAMYNYRDITADYMRSFNMATIQSSNYKSDNIRHNTSLLSQAVTF